MTNPEPIYEYEPPKIEFEQKFKNQTLSPEEQHNLWLFNNIFLLGEKGMKNEARYKQAVQSQENALNPFMKACDVPKGKTQSAQITSQWQPCREAVLALTKQRNETYQRAKEVAQVLLRLYENKFQAPFGTIDKKRVTENDDCPLNKNAFEITYKDLEKCQGNLVQAAQSNVQYKLALDQIAETLEQLEQSLQNAENEFWLAEQKNKQKLSQRKMVIRQPKLMPPTKLEQAAIKKGEENAEERLNELKNYFTSSEASRVLSQLFSYRPEEKFPTIINPRKKIQRPLKTSFREKTGQRKLIERKLTSIIQQKVSLTPREKEELVNELVNVYGSQVKNYPEQIADLWEKIRTENYL